MKKVIDDKDDLPLLKEMLKDLQQNLEEAKTDPNYDDEFRESDILEMVDEIAMIKRNIKKIEDEQ